MYNSQKSVDKCETARRWVIYVGTQRRQSVPNILRVRRRELGVSTSSLSKILPSRGAISAEEVGHEEGEGFSSPNWQWSGALVRSEVLFLMYIHLFYMQQQSLKHVM